MRNAIVVVGHGLRHPDGTYRISSVCLALVREAERLAEAFPPDAVVFTGWSRRGASSEAEQMRAAWRGPDVELVVESTASVTAENASRTLPLLTERGIGFAVVVCAPLHIYRTRFFFSRLYGARGIETAFHVTPVTQGFRALVWELAAAALCRRQLRAVQTELAETGGR
jgi:uncharacterized SAM-binding protein YcdF (DUF218 family)